MARVQVDYSPGAEALQTRAQPNVQTEQANFDPRRSSAFQLAEALGAPAVQQELAKMQERATREAEAAGRAYANSKPVSEFMRDVQEGKALPSNNPVFRAAVNHTYGENALNQFSNDTISKMNRGELVFEDDPEGTEGRRTGSQKLDDYLTEGRNNLLAGTDKYAIAGFDKKWLTVREQITDANSKVLDRRFQEQGLAVASEGFATVYDEAKQEGLSPEETAGRIMGKYDLFRSGSVLSTPEQQKAGLKAAAMAMATAGDQEALAALLDTKMPNNGPKVRFFLDSTGQDATILQKNAEAAFDKRQREETDNGLTPFRAAASNGQLNPEDFQKFWEPRQRYIGSATIQSIINENNAAIARKDREVAQLSQEIIRANENDKAIQTAQASIAAGRPIQDVLTADGRSLKAQDIGAAAMQRVLAENPDMSPQEVIRRHALSGVRMPELEREVSVAVANIGETVLDAAGKPVGELMPATIEALDKFALARQVSEGYARELAGSERNYETMVHIMALRENGIGDINKAAALVNQKNRRNIPPAIWGNMQKSVNAEIEQITNPGFFTGRFWGEVFRWEMGEGEKNLVVVKDHVRSLAETYLAAGVASDASSAVQKAAEYYADPRVTTQINNTIYLNKDLPELPEGMDRASWFARAIDGVVGSQFQAQGLKYNRGDVVLVPQDGGNRPYAIMYRGVFQGVVPREDIKNWIMTESDREDQELVNQRTKPKSRGMGPKITFQNPEGTPSPYASPEEWQRFRDSQKAK
jgi:hypothetical protein